jgi:hypothetical protein
VPPPSASPSASPMLVLEANIDDATPQVRQPSGRAALLVGVLKGALKRCSGRVPGRRSAGAAS